MRREEKMARERVIVVLVGPSAKHARADARPRSCFLQHQLLSPISRSRVEAISVQTYLIQVETKDENGLYRIKSASSCFIVFQFETNPMDYGDLS